MYLMRHARISGVAYQYSAYAEVQQEHTDAVAEEECRNCKPMCRGEF